MRLAVAERARQDLARIWDFNIQRGERGERVQRQLMERAMSLPIAPNSGRRLIGTNARRLSVPDIQYAIDYELAEEVVLIVRIRSTREIR